MSLEREPGTETIYVYLPDEAVDVWRPTLGRLVQGTIFQLLPTTDDIAQDEVWEFSPGAFVECEERELDGDRVLLAVRQVSPPTAG